jgi:hypothetical protein
VISWFHTNYFVVRYSEEAIEAARVVGITMLATMRQQFGSLDNIVRIVKVNGRGLQTYVHFNDDLRLYCGIYVVLHW